MDALVELARHQGEVVSRQQFQESVWDGRIIVTEGLTRCISELRRALGDKPRQPIFIETLSKRGYRFLPTVLWFNETAATPSEATAQDIPSTRKTSSPIIWAIGVLLLAAAFLVFLFSKGASQDLVKSIELNSPEQLHEVLANNNLANIETVWRNSRIPSNMIRVQFRRFTVETESKIRVKIQDGNNLLLLNTVLPYNSEQEKDSAISSTVSALELLATKNVDPQIIKLPEPLRITFQQADHAAIEGDESALQKAVVQFDEILAARPNFIPAIIGKSRAYKNLGVYTTIEDRAKYEDLDDLLMQKLTLIDPNHPYLIAKTYQPPSGAVNWEDYQNILEGVVARAPNCFECVKRLSDFYLILGWRNKAIDLHLEHLSHYPMSSRAHAQIADLYARAGNKEATRKHTEIVRLMGNPRHILAAETNNYFLQGESEKWIEHFVAAYKALGVTGARLQIPAAIANAEREKLAGIYNQLPFSFNLALNVDDIDAVVNNVEENIEKRNYDVLAMVHGWVHPPNDLNRLYRVGLSKLKQRSEIKRTFDQIGLSDYWAITEQWPDDCSQGETPVYCEAGVVSSQ